MTTPLHDLLDELGASAAPAPPALAERAWTDGRRRRVRSRVQAVVAAAAALLLLALVTPVLLDDAAVPQFARSGSSGVDGHPERIGHQWWVRDLPDRPGPVAAVLEGDSGSFAVRADGYRWRLPGGRPLVQMPAVSPTGRLLGYLETPDGPYVVQDLVTGSRSSFPELFAAGVPAPGRYQLAFGTPRAWSPDGRYLLIQAAEGLLLLDVGRGSLRVVPSPAQAYAFGWAGEVQIAWLERPAAAGGAPAAAASQPSRFLTTDLRGRVLTEVQLEGAVGLADEIQFLALAPNGRELAVAANHAVSRFSTTTGQPLHPPVTDRRPWTPCGTWPATRRGMLVPTHYLVQEVTPEATRAFTVIEPRVGPSCIHWAQDAVSGPGRGGGLLGTSGAAWTWWWKEALLALAVAAGLVWLAYGLGRRAWQRRRARRADGELIPWRVDWYS